jgi:hypothetical protein
LKKTLSLTKLIKFEDNPNEKDGPERVLIGGLKKWSCYE